MNENKPSARPPIEDPPSLIEDRPQTQASEQAAIGGYPVSVEIDADSPSNSSIPASEPSQRRRWPWYLLGFITFCLLLFLLLTFIWLSRFDRIVSEKLDTAVWDIPAKVFARPLELYAGQNLGVRELTIELNELGYRQNLEIEDNKETGSYNIIQRPAGADGIPLTGIEIHLREFAFADSSQAAQTIVVDIRNTTVVNVETTDETHRGKQGFRLDPLLIGTLHLSLIHI